MKVILYNRDGGTHAGGDMIQIRAYERELQKLGVEAQYEHSWDLDISGWDLVNLTHLNFGWTWRHYMVCKKYNKPYVISAIFYPFEQGDMDKSMMREVLDGCRKIMFLSKAEAKDCEDFLGVTIPEEKKRIINNGVDEIFSPDGYLWNGAKDYVMTAGRWEYGKGQQRVVEACKALGLPVVAIGAFGEKKVLDACLEMYPTAICKEAVPHEEMPDIYRGAKVYVCSSESERHNLCLMEAAACGCNLVSSTENRGNEWYGPELTKANPYHGVNELMMAIAKEYNHSRSGTFVSKIPYWSEVAKDLKKIYEEALNG